MSDTTTCIIITGVSGAGKTTAMHLLEDSGFFASDNIPPTMLKDLIDTVRSKSEEAITNYVCVMDLRAPAFTSDMPDAVMTLRNIGIGVKVIFLDASDECLARRYATTRRLHRSADGVSIIDAISVERSRLSAIKNISDVCIDTTDMTPADLRPLLLKSAGIKSTGMSATVSSFGFKYGLPCDCDYVYDVRFLPNPNYVTELKPLSGQDAPVQAYLDRIEAKDRFVEMVERTLELAIREFDKTDKRHVHIAFGCTGGRHRSVAVAEAVAQYLGRSGYDVSVRHRDINKDAL